MFPRGRSRTERRQIYVRIFHALDSGTVKGRPSKPPRGPGAPYSRNRQIERKRRCPARRLQQPRSHLQRYRRRDCDKGGWKTGRLADIKIVVAVVVEVSGGDPTVTVDVDAGRFVQDGAPVVGAPKHLSFVRLNCAKSLRADIQESRLLTTAEGFLRRRPTRNAPVPGVLADPL